MSRKQGYYDVFTLLLLPLLGRQAEIKELSHHSDIARRKTAQQKPMLLKNVIR